jgi:lipase maturation factor 1
VRGTATIRSGMMSRPVPVLIYDADCGFCRRWIARWQRVTGERVRYLPFQRVGVRWRFRVPKRDARRAAQLVEPDGRRSSGAAAMLGALRHARGPWIRLLARVGLFRGVRTLADLGYRLIAAHRTTASRVQRTVQHLFGSGAPRGRLWQALCRPGLAARGLGLVYVIAFASLRRQVLGLYGSRGIRPVQQHLDQVNRQVAPPLIAKPMRAWLWRLRAAPSLLWLDASDPALVRLCRIGEVAGAALAFGFAPRAAALVAWCAYLSFVSTGREFLRFQWDALLLESGLDAVVGGRYRRGLMRLLAFRLQFESGLAKVASRDPTWRNLTACAFHQETQPLPTPVGWYAHHLPRWIQRAASALTLVVECGVPMLAFGPRRARELAFATLSGFQGLIALTGNFAFFNWLTVVLNLAIIEERPVQSEAHPVGRAIELLSAGTLALLATTELAQRLRPALRAARRLDGLAAALEPMHAVSSYGLFASMTTTRPEIVIEGSNDGQTWREYGFRHKPGDVMRAPGWVAPHQPRLDWQMWFAALHLPPAWFPRFLARLLEGSPDVLALLGENPFPERPPRYVRALLYEYEIADLQSRRQRGVWWVRARSGLYFPPDASG